jgi:MFS family permease
MPLNHVSETFHQTGDKEAARMAWHVAGYSLTVGSFIIIAGRLGDMYGAKRIFVFGWIWFAASSLLCGFSALTRSPIFFDVTRALQGIGPVLLLPNALAIAGRTYAPGMKKNIVFSMIALSAPLGCAIGGLIGASIAQYWWWPWSAWLSALACSAVALTAYLVVPTVPKVFLDGEKSSFDWIGSVLAVSGLVLLNVSWNQAPIDGWSTPHVYVLLILGFISIGLFAWWEKRAERPLIDTSVFNARVAGILMCTGLGWSSFGVWFFYMFQFLAHMRGNTSLDSALQFGPGALSGVLAALFTAWAIPRVPVPWLLVVASVAYLLGCLLIALAPVKQSYWFNVFWSFVVMPWG